MLNAVRNPLRRICLVVLLTLAALVFKTTAYAAGAKTPALSFPSVTAKPGDSVDLDITIKDNPGIIGMTLEVNYDSRLTLANIKNGKAFEALEMTKPGVLEPGCRIHWDAVELAEGDVKDGVIATLTFTLSDSAQAGSSCFVRVAGASDNGQIDAYDAELQTVELKAASGNISVAGEEPPQPVRVTGVALDQRSISITEEGQVKQLHARVIPENADDTSVSWSSSNQAVASVSASGLVTAVANGKAVITAKTRDGGFTASCAVDVNIPEPIVSVTGISLDSPTLNLSALGERAQLKATVEPSNATDASVRWASSNPSVATVSDDGLVTALAEGVTTIMVSTVDGGYMKACVVTVAVPLPVISLEGASISLATESCVYTGEEQTPVVTVSVDNEELLESIDYALSYEDNVNVGEARVTVTGKGRYEGAKELTFSIVPASIAGATVSAIDEQGYTGNAIKPTPTIKLSGITLEKDNDYTLSYKANTKVGTATVTVTGKGNYTGTKMATFKIVNWSGASRLPVSATAKFTCLKGGYLRVKSGGKNATSDSVLSISGWTITGKKAGKTTLYLFDKRGKQVAKKTVEVFAIHGKTYEFESSVDKSYVLDIQGGSKKDGAQMIVYKRNNGANQKYQLYLQSDGTYAIRSKKSGKWLTVESKGSKYVQQWAWKGGGAQTWRLTVDASNRVTFVNVKTNKCFDVQGGKTKNSAKMIVWQYNGGLNQKWKLNQK